MALLRELQPEARWPLWSERGLLDDAELWLSSLESATGLKDLAKSDLRQESGTIWPLVLVEYPSFPALSRKPPILSIFTIWRLAFFFIPFLKYPSFPALSSKSHSFDRISIFIFSTLLLFLLLHPTRHNSIPLP